MTISMGRRLTAEVLGSALLTTVVIGSGIAAQRLSPGDIGLELLENALATAAGLFFIISVLGPVSGAQLNPIVSLADTRLGKLSVQEAAFYIPAQIAGCCIGAIIANVMFSVPAITISTHHRATSAHFVAEIVATAGLVLVIFGLSRAGKAGVIPSAVSAYIGAAYFFTSSTSFANPAIAVGRMLSNTFAGISPGSVPLFVLAEVCGGAIGVALVSVLYPDREVTTAVDDHELEGVTQ